MYESVAKFPCGEVTMRRSYWQPVKGGCNHYQFEKLYAESWVLAPYYTVQDQRGGMAP